jgi:hypothetical protein
LNYSYELTVALANDRRRQLLADAERSQRRAAARRARHEARRRADPTGLV